MSTVLLAVAALSSASASTFERVTLPELASSAEAVVQIRILETESRWDVQRNLIETFAEVEVARTLRGGLVVGEIFTLKEVGGAVDSYHQSATGFPSLVAGDDLVVFLTHWDDGNWRIHGYGAGTYRVVTEKGTGKHILLPGPVQDLPGNVAFQPEAPVAPRTAVDTLAKTLDTIR